MIDHIVIQEDLKNSEHVRGYNIQIITAKTGRTLTVHEGTNIGNKAIIQIPPVKVRGVVLEIIECDGKAEIKGVSVHYVSG